MIGEAARAVMAQVRFIWRVLRHRQTPWTARLVAACCMAYFISPIQLIPNFIPVIGQLDDLLVLSVGLKLIRKMAPQSFAGLPPITNRGAANTSSLRSGNFLESASNSVLTVYRLTGTWIRESE